MKKLVLLIPLLMFCIQLAATHNLGAYITYTHISGYKYQITLTTFTDSRNVNGDRLQVTLSIDNKYTQVQRQAQEPIGEFVFRNTYTTEYNFAGAGTYVISFTDANRTRDILNISNSLSQPLYVETQIIIHENSVPNNSVKFAAPPILNVAANAPVTIALSGFDTDGDSVVYKFISAQIANGTSAEGYFTPKNARLLNNCIYWKPETNGNYLFTILAEEYNGCRRTGSVMYEFTVSAFVNNAQPGLQASCSNADTVVCTFNALTNSHISFDIKMPYTGADMQEVKIFDPQMQGEQPIFSVSEDNDKNLVGSFSWSPEQQNFVPDMILPFVFRAKVKNTYAAETDKLVLIKIDGSLDKGPCNLQNKPSANSKQLFSVYPNPFSLNTTIYFDITEQETSILKLYNINGQPVLQLTTTGNKFTVYKNDLPPGVYIYHIYNSQKIPQKGKLLIQ